MIIGAAALVVGILFLRNIVPCLSPNDKPAHNLAGWVLSIGGAALLIVKILDAFGVF